MVTFDFNNPVRSAMRGCILISVLLFFSPPLSGQKANQSIFLIGDSGEPYIVGEKFGTVLRKKVEEAGPSSVVLYLGDNVYPAGMPERKSKRRAIAEQTLLAQVDWIKGLDAKGIFMPGNHDWAHWTKGGLQHVLNQQQWIDSLKLAQFSFLPTNGCPGPVEIPLDHDVLLVVIDTQWFLHQFDKPGEDSDCECKSTSEAMTAVSDIFVRNPEKRIVVAAHHPLVTYGEHGGVFTLKNHIFPLLDANPKLYLPLPVIGSIYPLYRKLFGHIQDTAHPLYKEFRDPLLAVFKEHPGNIFVSGHEHALEYIVKDSSHLIVSGSGSKMQFVRKKKSAVLAQPVRGFVQMKFYDTGECEFIFFQVDAGTPDGREIFRTNIPAKKERANVSSNPQPDKTQFVKVKASSQYHASSFKKWLLGDNYRKEWETEISVPVIDLATEKGGLKILQRGGGQQTLSLRLEAADGKEYVVRSVEKFPEKAVPPVLRKTFAQDLVQDQISASHPYAALIVPRLAESAGIYHTNPKLVFIPDDPALGIYQSDFANTLAIFEERPSGNWEEMAFFGNSNKIINTSKVLEALEKDNDDRVDQEFVLRSRLFDLIIGDWDRHDDQWRWAPIKGKKGTVFRPIPRDRDQAFFGNEGVIPKLWSRRWALPKFEGFNDAIRWPSGLSFNARYFDRSFLNELTLEDWLRVASSLKADLTDKEIEQAVHQWPDEIFNLHGDAIIRKLKKRRDALERYARSHYEFLARESEVVGSNKNEDFLIVRHADENMTVKVFKLSRTGERGRQLYERTFEKTHTKEVRIFGRGGDDQFTLKGEHGGGIKVRIIGGDGDDKMVDSIPRYFSGRATQFYDQTGQFSFVNTGEHIRLKSSDDEGVNAYDRKSFRYNRLAPLIIGSYNPDDGVFVGGGFVAINHGFRKDPFKQRHIFLAAVAPATRSYNFRYQGRFTEVIGKWNVDADLNLKSPNYVNNFFGWGNESVFRQDLSDVPEERVDHAIDYYRYRFEELRLDGGFSRPFGKLLVKIGPSFQRIEMEEPKVGQNRFITTYATSYAPELFSEYRSYGGASYEISADLRNHPQFTKRGIHWIFTGRNMAGLNPNSNNFGSYESSLALYYSLRSNSRLVLAARVGAGANTGSYQFYQAQILDGKTELRGFRKTRFYGDEKMFSNFEVRLRLLNFRTYLFPASFGILAFHDLGRVWYKNAFGRDSSNLTGRSAVWHKSVGGGLWFTPFNLTVLSTEIGHSKEGNLFYVRLGFLF